MSESKEGKERILNLNLGILGHVDSGKTSLSKALSTTLSTAALDKIPQSQARGITLDLGFSAFSMDVPAHLKDAEGKSAWDKVQYTLVDCPGHASLIRTVLGGAQIIDMMLLVIDVTKGIQTQTAECLVIAEILVSKMVVVLNKTDMLKDPAELPKIKERLRDKVFRNTKFGKDVPMVAVSANPGGSDANLRPEHAKDGKAVRAPNVTELLDYLARNVAVPERRGAGNFLFAVDHCFAIKGRGTVLTGTVLDGTVSVNQTIEIPALKLERPVKSMQMFHKPVQTAQQGDRVGICVTQFDPSLFERGVACAPGTVGQYSAVLASVERIRFFKGAVEDGAKFHVSVGHETCMATVHFFGRPLPSESLEKRAGDSKASKAGADEKKGGGATGHPWGGKDWKDLLPKTFDFSREYTRRMELQSSSAEQPTGSQFAVIEFDSPVICPADAVLIGSRLDASIHSNTCRLAFCGRLLQGIDFSDAKQREKIKVFAIKERVGAIDRVHDAYMLIGRDMFAKGDDISRFIGMKVYLEGGQAGKLDSAFGKSGKFKVVFDKELPSGDGEKSLRGKLLLRYKKYYWTVDKKVLTQ